VSLAAQLLVDLADAVDPEVVVEDLLIERLELLVAGRPIRGRSGLGGVVGGKPGLTTDERARLTP